MRSQGTVGGTVFPVAEAVESGRGPTVIVVDDEPRLVELVGDYLESQGMRVVTSHDGRAALHAARTIDADLMVLDLMLPELDGMQVCRRLREAGSDLPILMLTARGTVAERVAGLEAGADDYLVKPFALEELQARINALLRRRSEEADEDPDRLVFGDLVVHAEERRLLVKGDEVELTGREFAMILSLMENAGRVVSRGRLFNDVWEEEDIRSNAIDVHMSRLRQRLAGSTVRIRTLRGVGYRLEVDEP